MLSPLTGPSPWRGCADCDVKAREGSSKYPRLQAEEWKLLFSIALQLEPGKASWMTTLRIPLATWSLTLVGGWGSHNLNAFPNFCLIPRPVHHPMFSSNPSSVWTLFTVMRLESNKNPKNCLNGRVKICQAQ